MNDEKQSEQKPIDYNEELKKCLENPLFEFAKHFFELGLKAKENKYRTKVF